jgi:CRP/FNR family transcriptional regulator, cyclic AMP receptor protein
MTALSVESVVVNHPFVKGMSEAHLRLLIECAMPTRFEAGQIICSEGEIANRFYLIQRGKVSIETRRNPDEVIPVQTVGDGEVLGWSWLFPPYYWHFSACAVEPTLAVFFYGTRLREHCETDRDFGYELMKRVASVLIRRLQVTLKETVRLASSPPAPR